MGRFDQKSIVIIGGTSGVGLATAQLFEREGARVLVTGRSKETERRARENLGPEVLAVRSDTASLADVERLAIEVERTLGAIDLLFVNAGISTSEPFQSVTEAHFDEVMAVNAKGPYFTVQRLAPMIRPGGAVVLTTSVSNVKGQAGASVYAASKAALRSMARTLAQELIKSDVRVNAVSPGPIETGILERSLPADSVEGVKESMRKNNPMGRFGRPEEVAAAVAFLGFEATFTTGAELPVDGGVSQLL